MDQSEASAGSNPYLAMAGMMHGAKGASKLKNGVTRDRYTSLKKEYKRSKKQMWEAEIRRNPNKYSDAQKTAVRNGKAPKGDDGHPMEVHHHKPLAAGGDNSFRNLRFMTRTKHRLGSKQTENHPDLYE